MHPLISRRSVLSALSLAPLATAGQRLIAQPGRSEAPYIRPQLGPPVPDAPQRGFGVYDPAPLGYVAEERLMSGSAATYRPIHEADFTVPLAPAGVAPDPQGGALGGAAAGPPPAMRGVPAYDPLDFSPREVLAMRPYVTRVVIYRPRDMQRFSGTVIVEIMHPGGGGSPLMWSVLNRFCARRGDVFVELQHPRTLPWLAYHWRERYGSLSCPDHTQVWSMISDITRLLKEGGTASPLRVRAKRAYLTGYSFTGLIATSFMNRHHAVTRMADGIPLFDGYPLGTGAGPMPPLDVPVMVGVNQYSNYNDTDRTLPSTSPSMIARPVRLAFDADEPLARRRRYEVPGFEHGPLPAAEPGGAIAPSSVPYDGSACYYQQEAGSAANPNPFAFQLYEGLFRNMFDWVEAGIAPPRAPLIETAKGKPLLDEHGNPRGGLRLPDLSVPAATYRVGVGDCALRGWKIPFTPERMRALYGTWGGYRQACEKATDQAVTDRWIVPERGEEMKAALARAMPTF